MSSTSVALAGGHRDRGLPARDAQPILPGNLRELERESAIERLELRERALLRERRRRRSPARKGACRAR
jgi:hypothetical protein